MPHDCRESRRRWLERLAAPGAGGFPAPPAPGEGVGDTCPACAAWERRNGRLVRALASLSRLSAPPALAERVFPAAPAPAAIRAIRALDRLSAPAVLDRLVTEELAAPAAARSERFVGNLPRLAAPFRLEGRVRGRLVAAGRPLRWAAAIALLAAAGVLAWAGLARRGTPDARPGSAFERYSFVVERPASADVLDPFARALAETLGGSPRREG
ncbi:MAG: hypothetical protein AB1726_12685 [Planctomycetota bacterium]